MASIFPEFFIPSSTNNHTNTSSFPNNNFDYSGGPVSQQASEENSVTMWNSTTNICTKEDFAVPFFDVDFGVSVDDFLPSEKIEIFDGIVPKVSPEYMINNHSTSLTEISGNNSCNGVISPGLAQNLMSYGLECNINNNGVLFDQYGEEFNCCTAESFPPEFKPFSFVEAQKNWGIMQSSTSQMMNGIEESNIMKVGRYSEEERKERIVRYLKKRNQRNFNKTIKYACRKTLADRRVRVRGRFARNNELCDYNDDHQQIAAEKITFEDTKKDVQLCCDDALQTIKYEDDEDWLHNIALCCWVNGGSNNI